MTISFTVKWIPPLMNIHSLLVDVDLHVSISGLISGELGGFVDVVAIFEWCNLASWQESLSLSSFTKKKKKKRNKLICADKLTNHHHTPHSQTQSLSLAYLFVIYLVPRRATHTKCELSRDVNIVLSHSQILFSNVYRVISLSRAVRNLQQISHIMAAARVRSSKQEQFAISHVRWWWRWVLSL